MENSRTKNTLLTMVSGVIQKIASIILGFASQWIFIHFLGMEYVSVDGLFTSTLSFLALADLGIGSAMTVYLYKPLANDDQETVKTYMAFYKKCYRIIGFVILSIGICLIPLLDNMVNFEEAPPINIYMTYILYLFNTAATYLFCSYKSSVLGADQKSYLINKNDTLFNAIGSLLKCIVVITTRKFLLALSIEIFIGIIKNIWLALKVDKLYPYLKDKDINPLSKETLHSLFIDVRALFINKIGSNLLTSTDNIVISMILSTIVIGYTAMYNKIIVYAVMIIAMLTTSFVGSVGNLNAKENIKKRMEVFSQLHLMNFWICCVSAVCLYQLSTPFMSLFYGENEELQSILLSQPIVACMVLHFYMSTAANILGTFKSTMGLLKQGCYLALFGGVMNILLDFLLAPKLGLIGIYIATLFADVFTIFFPKGYFVYRYGFKENAWPFILKMIQQMAVMIFCCFVTSLCCMWIKHITPFSFIVKGCICLLVTNVVLVLLYYRTNEFQELLRRVNAVVKK